MDFFNTLLEYQGQAKTVLKDYQLLIGMVLLPIIYFIPRIVMGIVNLFKRMYVLTIVIDEAPNLSGEVFTHFSKWLSSNRVESFTRFFEIDKFANLRVGTGPNIFKFKGSFFLVYTERRESKGFQDSRMGAVRILFFKWNLAKANEFVKVLKEIVLADDGCKVLRSDYGQWEMVGDLPPYVKNQRQYVDKKVYDKVNGVFNKMVNNPEEYISNGAPYKETIFLYGPPRTGKTNLIRHLSAKFNLDIMIISPSKLHELMFSRGRFRQDSKRLTVYLVEDIDSNSSLCEGGPSGTIEYRSKEADAVVTIADSPMPTNPVDTLMTKDDLSVFLNALDGVVPMHNAIVVLSSNFPNKLYKSIYGVGRVDHIVEVNYMSFNEVMQLLNWSADDSRYIHMLTYEGRNALPAKTIDMLRKSNTVDDVIDILEGRELAAKLHTVTC